VCNVGRTAIDGAWHEEALIVDFTALPEPRKRGGIAIRLPFDPAAEWGERDEYHLNGTIAGRGVRGGVSMVDGRPYLELGPAWCRDAHLDPDTPVQVVLQPEGPQFETLAEDFAKAFGADAKVRRFFDSLPTHYRKNYVRWVEEAKRPETRARRIAETVEALRAGKRQRDEQPRS
jgi:hypothetical protein